MSLLLHPIAAFCMVQKLLTLFVLKNYLKLNILYNNNIKYTKGDKSNNILHGAKTYFIIVTIL